MRIIKISGGIGNQLFQYGFYLYLKNLMKDETFILDDSFYKNQTKRSFEIKELISSDLFVDSFLSMIKVKALYAISKVPFLSPKFLFTDKEKGFDGTIKDDKKTIYLGYWQSYDYVKEHKIQLQSLFNKYEYPTSIMPLKDNIEKKASICLHVRRGDYVSESLTNSYHGVCDSSYYNEAVDLIMKSDTSVECIYVFSDDLPWVKENIKFELPVEYVDLSNVMEPDYIEILLFSLGKHKITANSTFSWWGAFLSDREGIVISPKQWFRQTDKNYDDIYIEGTIKL